MKCLDLFSGTGSFKKFCINQGWDCISLDIDGRSDINVDILEWNYKEYNGTFDIIAAFPPCNDYSILNQARPEKIIDLTHSNNMVKRAIDIINFFKPIIYIIENPQTGTLKKQSFMKDIPFVDIDYCSFGYPIRKRTRFWTNLEIENSICNKKCSTYKDGKHVKFNYMKPKEFKGSILDFRHTIPEGVFIYLFFSTTKGAKGKVFGACKLFDNL